MKTPNFTAPAFSLAEYIPAATAAHAGTSFVPEQRGPQMIAGFQHELNADRARIYATARDEEAAAEQADRYTANYVKYMRGIISARGGIISAMITGPAKFPTDRNQKRCRTYENRSKEFEEWRGKALYKAIKRATVEATMSELEIAREKLDNAQQSQEVMKAVNAAIKKAMKNGLDVLAKGPEVLAAVVAAGLTPALADEILTPNKHLGGIGFASYSLSNNNAEIRRMRQRVADLEAKEAAAAEAADAAPIQFEGGEIILNFEQDRLQIKYDERTDAETSAKLKKRGFVFSRRFGTWQRKLTSNAKYAAAEITGADMSPAPKLQAATIRKAKPAETYTLKAVDTPTAAGFTMSLQAVTINTEAAAALMEVRRMIKAAEQLPTAGDAAAWIDFAEPLAKRAADLSRGFLLCAASADRLEFHYHPANEYSAPGWQSVEVMSVTATPEQSAPVDDDQDQLPEQPAPVEAEAQPEPVAAQETQAEKSARIRARLEARAHTPESFAAQMAENNRIRDNWEILNGYPGPATVEQLALMTGQQPAPAPFPAWYSHQLALPCPTRSAPAAKGWHVLTRPLDVRSQDTGDFLRLFRALQQLQLAGQQRASLPQVMQVGGLIYPVAPFYAESRTDGMAITYTAHGQPQELLRLAPAGSWPEEMRPSSEAAGRQTVRRLTPNFYQAPPAPELAPVRPGKESDTVKVRGRRYQLPTLFDYQPGRQEY